MQNGVLAGTAKYPGQQINALVASARQQQIFFRHLIQRRQSGHQFLRLRVRVSVQAAVQSGVVQQGPWAFICIEQYPAARCFLSGRRVGFHGYDFRPREGVDTHCPAPSFARRVLTAIR